MARKRRVKSKPRRVSKARAKPRRVSKPHRVIKSRRISKPHPKPRRVSKARIKPRRTSHPRVKPLLYTRRAAPWLRNLKSRGDRLAAIRNLRKGLKEVREIYFGFDAKHGFDLRKLERLPVRRRKELHRYITQVRKFEARGAISGTPEFIIVRPRTKAERAALERRTMEGPGTRKHARRAYVVETGSPHRSEVRYIEGPVVVGWRRVPIGFGQSRMEPITEPGLRVELATRVKSGWLEDRAYLFSEILGWQPGLDVQRTLRGAKALGLPSEPWEQMLFAVREMVALLPAKTRGGKEAHYQFLSDTFGPIGSPIAVSDLEWFMRRFYERGGSGLSDIERVKRDPGASTFTQTIIGFQYVGTEVQAFGEKGVIASQEKRRARYREAARALARERRRIKFRERVRRHK